MSPIARTVADVRTRFDFGDTRPAAWRRRQLEGLIRLVTEHEHEFAAALWKDLRKPHLEAWATELAFVAGEARHALEQLDRWMAPSKVSTPLIGQPGSSRLVPEPLGVVLVIGAWNYPLQGVLAPLVSVLAAGNAAIVKPSELAPATAAVLAEHLPHLLDRDAVQVVTGGADVTTELLAERFDHICYTGGGGVGRIVMTAAARHLTPVTLELGGKSPVIVLPDADLEATARRVAWGKWINAGQTCLAPDYVLLGAQQVERFVPALERAVRAMYGADARQSPDYGRIVNERHAQRLAGYLADGDVLFGGQVDAAQRYVAPTALAVTDTERPVMREEVFGPILPLVTVPSVAMAQRFVLQRDKPLALYLFGKDKAQTDRLASEIPAGQVCINDVLMFTTVNEFPFGGVGASGMGCYSGHRGFENFSHIKPVMRRGLALDLDARYPPYSAGKFALLRRLR